MMFPAGHKHGTVLRVDQKVVDNLLTASNQHSRPQAGEKRGD
jgi:hypothetical protein